jgi:outer membrane murein-binding lipoprotein Lpp
MQRIGALLIAAMVVLVAGCKGGTEKLNQPATTTTPTAAEFAQRAVERRAVEAAIWGMPVVNYDLMYQAMVHQAVVFRIIWRSFSALFGVTRDPKWHHKSRDGGCPTA